MKSRNFISLAGIAALTLWLSACGGGSSNNPPVQPISVAFSAQPPSSLAANTTTVITAVVHNDSGNGSVTWSVTCGSVQCGSFTPTSTAAGQATTYLAPAAVPTNNTVRVIATSVTDPTKSASATITVTQPAGIAVSFNPAPPATLVQGTTLPLTVVVSDDAQNAGVNWTVTCGSSSCGSFSPTSTASAVATTYTAPAAIPAGNTVTVKATSVTDATKSASATITITTPALADGTYVYHAAGEDTNNDGSPYYVAGAFKVEDGFITGGEQDFVDIADGGRADALNPATSSLTVGNNGIVRILLDSGDPNVGVNGVITLSATKVSNSRLLITQFDSFAAASGSLDLQSTITAPSGGYAFNVSGVDNGGNTLFMGGVVNISGNALSVSNSVLDVNDNGNVIQGLTFTSGSITAPDQFGRVALTLTASASVPQFVLNGYIVGPNRIEFIEDPQDTLGATLGGTALEQGANSGTFTMAGVAGSTYVYTGVGADVNGLATLGGAFVLNANGTVSGNISVNDISCCGGATISGNWSILPNGRVTISNVLPSLNLSIPFAFQLYLDGNGNALELGVDASQGNAGMAYLQTGNFDAGNYTLSAFGFSSVNNQPAWSAAGPANVALSLNWSGFTDYNPLAGNPSPQTPLSATTDTVNGAFNITGLDITNTGADSYGYWPIDGSRAIAVEVDQNQLGILLIETVTP